MPNLIVAGKKISLELQFDRAISIGRHISNSLPLPDPEVSRHHAQILPQNGGFAVSDLGSRNGICLNGEKTRESVLNPGDVILLGSTLLFYEPQGKGQLAERVPDQEQAVWEAVLEKNDFPAAQVTTFSATELDDLITRWLNRTEQSAPIPYKLRSSFLQFALALDDHAGRGDLCRA
ncbi:FHA domain-containing protein, partial [bacterium]|nr:FHA domain-containing protein [bacterium]